MVISFAKIAAPNSYSEIAIVPSNILAAVALAEPFKHSTETA